MSVPVGKPPYDSPKAFWTTLPGLLSGAGALVGAIGTLIVALVAAGVLHGPEDPAAIADLAVVKIQAPASVRINEAFTVAVSVKNVGSKTSGSFEANLYVDAPNQDHAVSGSQVIKNVAGLQPSEEKVIYNNPRHMVSCSGEFKITVDLVITSPDKESSNNSATVRLSVPVGPACRT